METYGLPENYKTNAVNITLDQEGTFYWDPKRIRLSSKSQFPVYQWASRLISAQGIKTVFDVGCGFATKLDWLHKKHPQAVFWGIDQPNAVTLCRQHYNFGEWLGVDFENNPAVPPIQAGLTISSDVIEHLQNPDVLLDYLRRVTLPGGNILISTPERECLRGPGCLSSRNPYHVREWNYDEFARYLQSRGFKIQEHRILQSIRQELSPTFFGIALRRWLRGKTLRYNQAVLIKNV